MSFRKQWNNNEPAVAGPHTFVDRINAWYREFTVNRYRLIASVSFIVMVGILLHFWFGITNVLYLIGVLIPQSFLAHAWNILRVFLIVGAVLSFLVGFFAFGGSFDRPSSKDFMGKHVISYYSVMPLFLFAFFMFCMNLVSPLAKAERNALYENDEEAESERGAPSADTDGDTDG